ncbi:MAG: hypothetical protein JSS02_02525 [Planctomycetes bacterium]|nr:hypothetical protein [Planctomycetota bacterium]
MRCLMKRLGFGLVVGVAALLSALGGRTTVAQEPVTPTYEQHVAPFFKTYCLGCHDGGDDSKGGLSLLSHQTLLEGGDSGPALVPGKSGESRLVRMLVGSLKPQMPPKDSKQPKAEEIELVKRWVDLGAKAPVSAAPQSAAELKVRHIAPKTSVSAGITAVVYSPDGKWLAAARHRDVLLLQAETGRVVQTLAGAANPINALAFSPESLQVAAAEGLPGVVGHVRLWTIGNPEPRELSGHGDSIYAVAFQSGGQRLVTASYDKLLLLWDVAAGKPLLPLKHHTGAVFAAAFAPDGKSIASASADQTVKLWNAETGQRILTLTEATKAVNAVAFHPRGQELAAAGVDKMIRVYEWNGTTAKLKRSAFAHDAAILSLAYSPDGGTLFSGSEDRRVKAWDAATLQERHVYPAFADWPQALAVHPGGAQLAVALANGDLAVVSTTTAQTVREVLKAGKPVVAAGRGTGPGVSGARGLAGWTSILATAVLSQNGAAEGAPKPQPNPPLPRLDAVSPRTMQPGSKVKLTLSGQNIADADRLLISPGHLSATLVPGDGKNVNQAFCEVEIPADFPPGMVALRLHTPLGSTAAKSFYVGPFAEVGEKEDNNRRESATPAALPATLVGTIATKGDRDLWVAEAPADKDVVFVLVGPQLGSALNAKVSLLDESGRTVASATRQPWLSEVVIAHRFDRPQFFNVTAATEIYTGGGNHFYYVHAGTFAYVRSAFPLGMKSLDGGAPAGDQVQAIDVRGANLPEGTRVVPVAAVGTQFVSVGTPPAKSLNTVRFLSSSFPEYAEAEPNDMPAQARLVPVPSAISGRIAKSARAPGTASPSAGDADLVMFEARRGERLTLETRARQAGSPLDTVIDVLDAAGQPVPRATLRSVAETYSVLRDHDSRSAGIRLQHWEDFQPNDLLMLADEIVKVQIMPLGPDEDVKFFQKGGVRMGFLGTTPQAHAINSSAYKIEVHPPGTTFPPNGMPVVTLAYQNDDGGPGFGSDSQILFDVPADGRYYARVRDVRGLGGDDFVYRLVIRPRQEDFRVSLDPENPNVPRGGSLPVTVNLDRIDGFNGWVDIRLEGLPAGITATATRIGPDLFTGVLTLTAAETAGSPASDLPAGTNPGPLAFRVIGNAQIGEKVVEHATTPGFGLHEVTVTSPPDLKVRVEPLEAAILPGQEVRFTVTIDRQNGFAGRVPVDVLNLPHGLRVLDVGLNGVLINEQETSRSFVVACDPWAPAGPHLFYAAPRVESKGERHASAPLRLDVKTQPAVAAGN